MNNYKEIIIARKVALLTFLLGTVVFALYFLTSNAIYLFVGYAYMFIAIPVNITYLYVIIIENYKDPTYRVRLLKTIGIMLLNIPAAYLYIWCAMIISGNIRLSLTNTTNDNITNINITGCEPQSILELKPNESKTIWVGIPHDCAIFIDFFEGDIKKKETVLGYTTPGGGQILNHNIGSNNNFEF